MHIQNLTYHVQVTAQHIERCSQANPYTCAIATACREAGMPKPSVGSFDVKFEHPRTRQQALIKFDEAVVIWLKRFTTGHKVEPISFTLTYTEN